MKFRYGHYRYVLVFENFVIKFPRIRLASAFKIAWWEIGHNCLLRHFKRLTYRHQATIPWALFKGMIDNWLEYLFHRKTHYGFLVPTYFSFFGLVNIQARGYDWDHKSINHFRLLYNITNGDVHNHGHEFAAGTNFGYHDGRLKMFDYGSKRVQGVLEKYAEELEWKFNVRE